MVTAESHTARAPHASVSQAGFPVLPALFLIGLVTPVMVFFGPVRLTPYRIVLLIAFFGLVGRWLSGRAGPVRGFDICILLTFLWASMAYFVVHRSMAMIETSGILIIEAFGSYLLARTCIRTRAEFERVMRFFLLIVILLFPFAFFETITGRPILLELAGKVAPTFPAITQEKRLGLERAQVVFEHSILYGAFVSAAFSTVLCLYARPGQGVRRVGAGGVVFASSLFSVSGGALLALFFQVGLFVWEKITRSIPRRWLMLGLLFVLAYVVIDAGSNRAPAHVFISYLSFSAGSAYNRILIFEYGMQNVWANPIFGIGLGDWARPFWMGDSVDNFWLLIAMRHGVPAFLLFLGGVLWLMFSVGYRPLKSLEMQQARYTYMYALAALMVAGITVHYWNATFAFFMFVLGSGVWLTYAEEEEDAQAEGDAPRPGDREGRAGARYARSGDALAKRPQSPQPGPGRRDTKPDNDGRWLPYRRTFR